MAVFKLGAIITNIAGSIGGTTFRRGSGLPSMYNRPQGGSKSKLLKNSQLQAIGAIWQKWRTLDAGRRADWNLISLNYEFPNKFGTMRNITGRQLFSKLNIQLLPVGSEAIEPDQITDNVSGISIDNFDLTVSPFKAELQLNVITGFTWLLVQIEVSKNILFLPRFSRRKVTAFAWATSSVGFDITTQILEQFPYINSSYTIRAYVTSMNEFGFKNVTIFKDGIWIV